MRVCTTDLQDPESQKEKSLSELIEQYENLIVVRHPANGTIEAAKNICPQLLDAAKKMVKSSDKIAIYYDYSLLNKADDAYAGEFGNWFRK